MFQGVLGFDISVLLGCRAIFGVWEVCRDWVFLIKSSGSKVFGISSWQVGAVFGNHVVRTFYLCRTSVRPKP